MIIYLAKGQLGNQLFQFSYLCKIVRNNELVLTVGLDNFSKLFNTPKFRSLNFKLNKITYFLFWRILSSSFFKQLENLGLFSKLYYLDVNNFSIRQGILKLLIVESNFYQDHSYAIYGKDYLKIKDSYYKTAQNIFDQLPLDKEKIFVHIRRGDYLNQDFLGFTGVELPVSYYLKALNLMMTNYDNVFFIFISDDNNFVTNNFNFIKDKYISENPTEVDFTLMTLCSAGILSNSTFSWWGAALMTKKDLVLIPKYWWGWKSRTQSHIDIYPDWATVVDF